MDENVKEMCAEWCRSHYWQLQEKRGWRYAYHESVMVRYYEEANLDASLLESLVEFLRGEEWHGSFTVHNKPVDMTGWKTRDVWYETRDGDVKEQTRLKRTRIYHAVYKEGEAGGGDGPYTVENGCMWKVSHTFHWKVAELPAVPQGESGVQWRLQGVARDDETGLWSCVLEKRERVQQDVPEYVTAKTMFEHRSEEQHLGVRQSQVASTGRAASVGGGVMVRRQIRKNEDCTSDVLNDAIEEKPVSGAVTETATTLRGTRTTTVNRSQQSKAGGPDGLGSVRNELTEGGLWNQTIVRFAAAAGRWLRKACRKTLFLHEHSETEAVQEDPGFVHVVEAGGGVVTEKSVMRNDEGGFDVETRTRSEQSVPSAVVETRKFVDGVQTTTLNRGQDAPASAAELGVGESVRNELTDGGRVDQTIVKASVEPVGRTGEACEQNALVHTHLRTDGVGREVPEAEISQTHGQTRQRRVRMTERGAWEVTDETRTARPGEADARGGALGRDLSVLTLRNQQAIEPAAPGVNEEVDVTVQPNEFGLEDGTVRRTLHREMEETARSGNMLVREERTVKLNTLDGADREPVRGTVYDASAQPNGMGARNVTVVKRTARPALKTLEWTDRIPSERYTQVWRNRLVVFRNQEELPEIETAADEWHDANPSFQLNEFGLYDGVYRYRRRLPDEGGWSSGGPGSAQYDDSRTVTISKAEKFVDADSSPKKLKYKDVTVTKRILVSTMQNMLQEVAKAPGYPQYGLRSYVSNQGYAVIYSSLSVPAAWSVEQIADGGGSQ